MTYIRTAFHGVVATLFAALVLTILAQIIFRYFVGSSLSWAEEGARMMFVWLVYLGGILAVRQGINITFDLVLEALPHRIWLPAFIISNLCVCLFLALVAVIGARAAADMGQVSSILRMPMWLVFLAIPIGAGGMFMAQVAWARETIRGKETR